MGRNFRLEAVSNLSSGNSGLGMPGRMDVCQRLLKGSFFLFRKLSEMGDLVGFILDAVPSPLFVVDGDVRIMGCNQAASQMFEGDRKSVIRGRIGDVLHCIHSKEAADGCGRAKRCAHCIIRNSVNESISGCKVVRRKEKMELRKAYSIEEIHILVTTSPLDYQGQPLVLLILEDITEMVKLKSILPICASCKKIRNDQGYWDQFEEYLSTHSGTQFSHSVCPECTKKLYPDLPEDDEPDG